MNVRYEEGLCDEHGCTQAAVTERKVVFAVTELCVAHAVEYDRRNPAYAKNRPLVNR